MGRPATKSDLLTAAAVNFEKLNQLISSLTEEERISVFIGCHKAQKKLMPFIEVDINIPEMAERYSNEELFTKGVYKWVGGSTLGSYFVSTTSSHYDWAMKKCYFYIMRLAQKSGWNPVDAAYWREKGWLGRKRRHILVGTPHPAPCGS